MLNWELEHENKLVCYCNNVNKVRIVESIRKGNINIDSIRIDTSACTKGNCKIKNPSGKCCSKDILELVKIYKDIPVVFE